MNWLLGRYLRFRVAGASMIPTLHEGDWVFVDKKAYHAALTSPRVGDIVLAEHPSRADFMIVKRVCQITDGKYFLQGDNPCESTDSRNYGYLSNEQIHGRIVSRL